MSEENAKNGEIVPDEKALFYDKRSDAYAWSVLALLLVVRITIIWQRKSFNFIYGFQGEGLKLGDPVFEILSAYPNMDKYYGVLSGLAYSVPMSVCGLALGMLKGGFNRVFLMSAALMLAGGTQLLSGSVDSLLCLALMRVMHGAFNSIT